MSIFSGSTEMLRKVKEAIEKSASEVKEKLLGIIEDAKNEQEEVNSNLKQAIDREAARNDVQDEKIEDHERKIDLTREELNSFKDDQSLINKTLDSMFQQEHHRNNEQDELLKQHSEAIEKNTADILENADKAHQDLEAHKEESAAKFEDLSQRVDTNTQNIKQTREELQEQLGEHDNRITENKNQIAANAEKAERALESAVLDLKKSILETNKDVMQNATNINLISANVDKKIEGQNLRIEAIEDLLDELIKEVKEEFKVLHDNTTLNSEQISKLNQSVTEINSLVEKLELDTKENTENINLIFEVLADLENIREETSAEIDSKLEALLLGELSNQSHSLDYKNKISGSVELNPNVGRRGALRPDPTLSQSVGIGEMTQAQYDVLAENDGKTFTAQSAITFQASYGATFVFDVVENFKKTYPKLLEFLEAQSFEDVIQVIEKFVKNPKISINAAGYAGTERGLTIAFFDPETSTWEITGEHTEATPQKLTTNGSIIKNQSGNMVELNGKAVCIIRSPEISQSVQQGIIVDYAELTYDLEITLYDLIKAREEIIKNQADQLNQEIIDQAVEKAKQQFIEEYSDLREYVDGKVSDVSMEQINMNNRLSEFEGVTNQSIANVEMNANSRFREIETNLEGTKLESQATSEKVAGIEGEQTIIKNEISTLKGQVNDLMNGGTN